MPKASVWEEQTRLWVTSGIRLKKQVFATLGHLWERFSLLLLQAHLVAAFEQSLGNMTIRLKSLTLTAEQKVRT